MKQSERNIEKFFCETVKSLGGVSYKWQSPNVRGVPDRIALFPGGLVTFVELKRPGGKPHPLQLKIIRQIADMGSYVFLIDNIPGIREYKRIITEAMKENDAKEKDNVRRNEVQG